MYDLFLTIHNYWESIFELHLNYILVLLNGIILNYFNLLTLTTYLTSVALIQIKMTIFFDQKFALQSRFHTPYMRNK